VAAFGQKYSLKDYHANGWYRGKAVIECAYSGHKKARQKGRAFDFLVAGARLQKFADLYTGTFPLVVNG